MGLLRQRAASYDIDPHKVGVIRFSAAGHLAAAISNSGDRQYDPVDEVDREHSRPDCAILLYLGHFWDETSTPLHLPKAGMSPPVAEISQASHQGRRGAGDRDLFGHRRGRVFTERKCNRALESRRVL
jgi:hypothetical protein